MKKIMDRTQRYRTGTLKKEENVGLEKGLSDKKEKRITREHEKQNLYRNDHRHKTIGEYSMIYRGPGFLTPSRARIYKRVVFSLKTS
jgi:hypothetical protein